MPTSAHATVRILLVEDEPKLRASLAQGLSTEDWFVVSAAYGREAQAHLDTERFDVILLDWMLPDCEGLDIVRWLRAAGNLVPVLMMSARRGANVEATVRSAGVSSFLAKPFSFDDLLARTRALLQYSA